MGRPDSTLLRQPADLGGTAARRPLRAIPFLATPSDAFRIERLGVIYPMHKMKAEYAMQIVDAQIHVWRTAMPDLQCHGTRPYAAADTYQRSR